MTPDEQARLLTQFLCVKRVDGLAELEKRLEEQGGGTPYHQYMVRLCTSHRKDGGTSCLDLVAIAKG